MPAMIGIATIEENEIAKDDLVIYDIDLQIY